MTFRDVVSLKGTETSISVHFDQVLSACPSDRNSTAIRA